MNAAEKWEREVKKTGGKYSDEIIESVRALAEVDIEIKQMLDEIERVDDELIRRHNKLADKINSLVILATGSNNTDEAEKAFYSRETGNHGSILKIGMEIRVTETM